MITDPRLHTMVAAQPYPLLLATISGVHLYGFPSPDSDYDLRGAHILRLDAVVAYAKSTAPLGRLLAFGERMGDLGQSDAPWRGIGFFS